MCFSWLKHWPTVEPKSWVISRIMLPTVFLVKIIRITMSVMPEIYLKFLPSFKTGFLCQFIVIESYRILFMFFKPYLPSFYLKLSLAISMLYIIIIFLNIHLRTRAFQAPDECLLAGISICLSQVSQSDCKTLWALITFYGGVCSLQLSRKTTHLITTKPEGVSKNSILIIFIFCS